MTKTAVVLIACLFGGLSVGACSAEDRERGEPSSGVSHERLTEQKLLSLSVPAGGDFLNVALGARETLRLYDGASVTAHAGGFARVSNTGSALTHFGPSSRSADVVSVAPISVTQSARIEGSATSAGHVTLSSGAVVTGDIAENATLTPAVDWSWNVDFPLSSEFVAVYPGQTASLQPSSANSYSVFVYPGAHLSLTSGTYYLEQLNLDQQGTLSIDTSGGPVFLYVRTSLLWRGTATAHAAEDVFLGYLGSSPVVFSTSFNGTVVAPDAPVRFGIGGPAHSGSAFAKTVELDAGTTFVHRRFEHWGWIFPPTTFVTCVNQVAPGSFAALFGYENPLSAPMRIPLGPENLLIPDPAVSEGQPLSTFAPGRNDVGFWSLLNASELTWRLRGQSVTASTSSPGCNSSAYPIRPDVPEIGERPSEPRARKTKLIPYFHSSAHDPLRAPRLFDANGGILSASAGSSSASSSGIGTIQQPLTPAATSPFVIRLTNLDEGTDGCFASRSLDGEIFINGQSAGKRHLYEDGCVFCAEACPFGQGVTLNHSFSRDVPENQRTVSVRIKLVELDNWPGDDETVLDVSFDVDNTTGKMSGFEVAPLRGRAKGKDDWGIWWEVAPNGLPPQVPPTRLCPKWNTDYVDEGFGEQVRGDRASLAEPARYAASFAEFELKLAGPHGSLPAPITGFLDRDGCVELSEADSQALVHDPLAGTDPSKGGLALELVLKGNLERPDGVRYELRKFVKDEFRQPNPAPPAPVEEVLYTTANAGDVPLDTWTSKGIWAVPGATVPLHLAPDTSGRQTVTAFTNVAAALSRILATDDLGIVPDTLKVRHSGSLCVYGHAIDSCFIGAALFIGPATPLPAKSCTQNSQCDSAEQCLDGNNNACSSAVGCSCKKTCTQDSQCESVQQCLDSSNNACSSPTGCECRWPDQARFKFVTAHEAGHQIQDPAMGRFVKTDYTFICQNPPCTGRLSDSPSTKDELLDPPFVDTFAYCGCQHVNAANGQHCLQSIERSGPAQGEGFAQFFASKIWNEPGDPQCKFVYYKEFFDSACRAENPNDPEICKEVTVGRVTGIATLPPFGISCGEPFKWRNNHCPMSEAAEMGTELDWMRFFWNLNTVGTQRSPMADIWQIYKHACNPTSPNPGNCRSDGLLANELSWNEKPAAPAPGNRTCRESKECEDIPTKQQCMDATPGSVSPCTTATTNCVCKVPAVGGVLQGAERFYVDDADRQRLVRDRGDDFGVSENLIR